MTISAPAVANVGQWNDRFARTHDIDEYYTRASWPVRFVEQRRLAWICRAVGECVGQRVLEVGCGGGHVLRMFPRADLTGVDVSEVMLDKARRNLAGMDVRLLRGELHALDLPDGGFDCVICTEVIEHVVDPEELLADMARLLSPKGRIVITFPNDRLINRIKRMVIRTGLVRLPGMSRISWGGDEFHLHRWSVREMSALLSRFFHVEHAAFVPSRVLPIRCCFSCKPMAESIRG